MVYSVLATNNAEGGTNGTAVSTGNSGGASGLAYSSVTPGTGNTTTFDTTDVYLGTVSYKATQGSPFTAQNNTWWDWGVGITDPGGRFAKKWDAASAIPSTVVHRWFNGANGAGTILASMGITSTGKLQIVETNNANQVVDSTGTLSASTWYTFLWRYVETTGVFTINAYAKGSTTVAATVTMNMLTGYSFRSDRRGVSTANSGMGALHWDDEEIGQGGFAGRNDVAVSAPTISPDAAIDRVASASITVHANASVAGDLISAFTGSFTSIPAGASAPALTGTATGLNSSSASLTQTFTPSVPGWYTWTATATGSSTGQTGTGSQVVYVSPVVGQAVPLRSVNSVGYVNVGGAVSLAAAATDGLDTTYAESPQSPNGTSYVEYRMGPYGSSGIKFNPRGVKVGADATTRTVSLYKTSNLTTPVYTTSFVLSTTIAAPDVIVDGTGLAQLSTVDRRELVWRISDSI
jgi:hypothetical protein